MKSLAFMLVAVIGASAYGDIVYLKDGRKIEGDVKKGDRSYVVTQADGKFEVVAFDKVRSIELTPTTQPRPDQARERLASLRRSVQNTDDIGAIITRYERFISSILGTEAAEEAKQDLAVWEQRRAAGLVRFGSEWITPQDRAQRREQLIAAADQVRKLIRQGRLNEAETHIRQILADDPQNASALYLRGLLQYRQDQLLPSRKSFEMVNNLVPNHAPTLNNLAIILYRQNQHGPALNMYDQAMLASPGDKQVLNNVAEALYGMPDSLRASPVAEKVARHFTDQDVELQKQLAEEGLHRWGATWVTTEQREQLKAAEKEVKDKLDALSADFDATKVRIATIDGDIEDTERAMRRLEATSYVRDYNGYIWQSALPSTYYDLENDIRKLQRERDEQYAHLEKLRAQARRVDQDLPVAKYTGMQRVIDVEGTPVLAPDQSEAAPDEPTTGKSVG